jgi:hypothetical protein
MDANQYRGFLKKSHVLLIEGPPRCLAGDIVLEYTKGDHYGNAARAEGFCRKVSFGGVFLEGCLIDTKGFDLSGG